MILTIRTDNPRAEVGLFTEEGSELGYTKWQAHRQLSETILIKIRQLLKENSFDYEDVTGVVFYEGPGSFTGLRIGASVANAFGVPVASVSGDKWLKTGIKNIQDGQVGTALPEYGSEPHITKPKK